MKSIYQHILEARSRNNKLLAVLLDPDKLDPDKTAILAKKINRSAANLVLIGGSEVEKNKTERIIDRIQTQTELPIVLFPGHPDQVCPKADGLFFLSLLSGRNPDYLIEKHIEAVPMIESSNLEVIPTGYILIENGRPSSVERVSRTSPIPRDDVELICRTAKAGELLGMKLIYLEAGSGALHPVPDDVIASVRKRISIPIVVGGGIRSGSEMRQAFMAGADMVVIGTAIEEDAEFLSRIS